MVVTWERQRDRPWAFLQGHAARWLRLGQVPGVSSSRAGAWQRDRRGARDSRPRSPEARLGADPVPAADAVGAARVLSRGPGSLRGPDPVRPGCAGAARQGPGPRLGGEADHRAPSTRYLHWRAVNPSTGPCRGPWSHGRRPCLAECDLHAPDVVAAFCLEELRMRDSAGHGKHDGGCGKNPRPPPGREIDVVGCGVAEQRREHVVAGHGGTWHNRQVIFTYHALLWTRMLPRRKSGGGRFGTRRHFTADPAWGRRGHQAREGGR